MKIIPSPLLLKLVFMWKTNKNVYQSEEYKQFIFLRIINICIIIIIISLIGYGLYFIRKNVFNTIVQAEEVIILENNLISEVIDFKKYDSVSNAWNKKNETLNFDKQSIKDPFNSNTTTPTIL